MNERNFQRELDRTLQKIEKEKRTPTLLLHSCCAPCSSYVLEYLSEFFQITVLYYNPNISPAAEYEARIKEQERFIREVNRAEGDDEFGRPEPSATPEDGLENPKAREERTKNPETVSEMPQRKKRPPISFMEGVYEPERFYETVRGLEKEPEGGARCTECFRMRLLETARLAKEGNFDYFTTTLTISPRKDAKRLNLLGEEIGNKFGVSYLTSDFKKKNGHGRSRVLADVYGLYRQDYCGCVFSREPKKEEEGFS